MNTSSHRRQIHKLSKTAHGSGSGTNIGMNAHGPDSVDIGDIHMSCTATAGIIPAGSALHNVTN